MPNLHERAFALARTALRNRLLGWHEPDPEILPENTRRSLIAFAIATWVYRLTVFLGIAVAVYVYFFKLLGIFLFAVEIAWFVLGPLWRELRVWHQRQHEIPAYRKRTAIVLLSLLLLVALIPWSHQIHAPGFAHPTQVHTFYSPLAARLVGLPEHGGTAVASGQALFALEQPELAYKARQASSSAETLASQLRGLAALNDGEERRAGLKNLLAMHAAEVRAQQDEANRLILQAPFAGILTDIAPELARGVWVAPRQQLAVLVDPTSWQAEVLVDQHDLHRIQPGNQVRFYPEGSRLFPLSGKVTDTDQTRTPVLPHLLLSSQHGGSIPVLPDQKGLTPRDALYRVRVQLTEPPEALRILRGEAVIAAAPESWLLKLLKPVLIVITRELSF